MLTKRNLEVQRSWRLGRAARLLALLGLCSCGELFCPSIREPIEATIEVEGVDAARIVAGTFRDPGPHEASILMVDDTTGGILVNGGEAISLPVLQPASANTGLVRFTFPEDPDVGGVLLHLLAFYDADGDGELDLDPAGESEVARVPGRELNDDQVYIVTYGYSPESEVVSGAKYGGPDVPATYLSDNLRTGWKIVIDGETESGR